MEKVNGCFTKNNRNNYLFLLFLLCSIIGFTIQSMTTYADEYFYSNNIPGTIDSYPLPEEAKNSKINIKDGFNTPGSRQEFSVTSDNNWQKYYDGNSTYKVPKQQNMAILYNDSWFGQKGMLWYNMPISLNYSFETESYIMVNAQEIFTRTSQVGASNGIAFVLQNDPKGKEAIGGRGGGIGVFPGYRDSVNMIYNALAIEFDTSANSGNVSKYPYTSALDRNLGTMSANVPHMAISSTYVPSTYSGNGINYVWDNFTHDALIQPTPATIGSDFTTEGDSWFNQWIKLSVKWTPDLAPGISEGDQANIKTGTLSYKLGDVVNPSTKEVYSYNWQSKTGIDIDKTFNTKSTIANWDRKVYWGYTGGGSIRNDGQFYIGNYFDEPAKVAPAALAVTKLPFEPDIDLTRKVKNVTKSESEYTTSTHAHVGDIVEYQISVKNNVMDQSKLPFSKFLMQDDLQNNKYVESSFAITSPNHVGPTGYVDTANGVNKFSVGLQDYSTASDSQVTDYTYQPGESFTYTYQVKIGSDNKNFINSVDVNSAYTEELTQGETNVIIDPSEIGIKKSVLDSNNPKVGESTGVALDTINKDGILNLTEIKDVIPEGFTLKANSTQLIVLDSAGSESSKTALDETSIWTGNNLSITTQTLNNLSEFQVIGGTKENNTVRVYYEIVPTETVKGKQFVLPTAEVNGTNIFGTDSDKLEYNAVSTTVDIKVKTDVTVNFIDNNDKIINSDWIISKDSLFNGKNPVQIYFNTGDAYDYESIINEISTNLKKNNQLTKIDLQGEIQSAGIPEKGNVITIKYSSKSTITVEFLDEKGKSILDPVSVEGIIGQTVNLSLDESIKSAITTVEQKNYDLDQRPTNETAVPVTSEGTTVQYHFKGMLIIKSKPKDLDFGIKSVGNATTKVDKATYDTPLVIWDNRADLTSWTLTAQLEDSLRSQVDTTKVLPDAIRYKVDSKATVPITTNDAQPITVHTHDAAGEYNISSAWDKGETGFQLEIPAGGVRKLGEYQTTILWQLGETP